MKDRQARLNEVARIAVKLEAETGCPAQLMNCAVGRGNRLGRQARQ